MLEFFLPGCNGFITLKTKLRVVHRANPESGTHQNPVQYHLAVPRLPKRAARKGPVIRYPVCFHHFPELIQDLAHFLHDLVAQTSVIVRVFAKRQRMAHMIDLADSGGSRNLENSQLQFEGTHINSGKGFNGHIT